MSYTYLKDPQKIERYSFDLIRTCTHLDNFDPQQTQIAMRIVHTCGLPEVVRKLRFSAGATEAGLRALQAGAPILCDVEMVAHGISHRFVGNPVHCYLNRDGIAQKACASGQTRSMAALDYWRDHLKGAIAVVGNAPTALFRLLELIHQGAPRPALVIGVPVGFVGAAESKQALWDDCGALALEAITLLGEQGGSAIASAIVNALGRVHKGVFF